VSVNTSSVAKLFLPSIKVNCWGGYGSQLNAVATAFDLQLKFPFRRVIIFIRTGGIHEAQFELKDLDLNEFNFIEKKIITTQLIKNSRKSNSKFFKFRQILTQSLNKIGFYSICESRNIFNSLKPWIISLRGSYNYYPSPDFIEFLNKKLINKKYQSYSEHNFIHFRLGDLITSETKSPLSEHLIFDQICKIENKSDLYILSANPDIAKEKFEPYHLKFKTHFLKTLPDDVLYYGVCGNSFIGTNSKISLWVVILRLNLNLGNNFLPKEFKFYFTENLERELDVTRVNFF